MAEITVTFMGNFNHNFAANSFKPNISQLFISWFHVAKYSDEEPDGLTLQQRL